MSSIVLTETRANVVILTLNRPEAANALSKKLVSALLQKLAEIECQSELRVVVLTAAGGRAFCAGADLKERKSMDQAAVIAFLQQLRLLTTGLEQLKQPVIAAIDGAAMGGGLELALACDLRVASAQARFALPETSLGIIPGAGGTQRLTRLIGLAQARDLILTARKIDAPQALALGLVNELTTQSALPRALEIAQAIAANAPLAVQQAKRAINQGFGLGLSEALDIEQQCYLPTLHSADRVEALKAFAEKRAPAFRGI